MNDTQEDDIPIDIWRYILTFVAPSSIHHCSLINKSFNNLCSQPQLYGNLVCRIKSFSSVPLKIDDDISTVSISVHDQYNSYFEHCGEIHTQPKTNNSQSKVHKILKIWLKRLTKCKYLDMGSFPLDAQYLNNNVLNIDVDNATPIKTFYDQ
eukprot:256679_1